MIYITGDTHGEISRFMGNNMGDSTWTAEDVLIVCGDFGFVYYGNEKERAKLDALEKKPYTVCFCDGNYHCVMASGNREKGTANLLLYESEDLFDWKYCGTFRCQYDYPYHLPAFIAGTDYRFGINQYV